MKRFWPSTCVAVYVPRTKPENEFQSKFYAPSNWDAYDSVTRKHSIVRPQLDRRPSQFIKIMKMKTTHVWFVEPMGKNMGSRARHRKQKMIIGDGGKRNSNEKIQFRLPKRNRPTWPLGALHHLRCWPHHFVHFHSSNLANKNNNKNIK